MPSLASQLFAKIGESYPLCRVFNIFMHFISSCVKQFSQLLGNFSTIVGYILTSCFYDMFQEVLKLQNLYKFIKINHTWLNCFFFSFFFRVIPKNNLVTLHKAAWTLWRICSPVRNPNFTFCFLTIKFGGELAKLKKCMLERRNSAQWKRNSSLLFTSSYSSKDITRYG